MSFFGSIARVASKVVKPITKIPGVKAIPGVGTAIVAADLALTGYDMLTGKPKKAPAPAPLVPRPMLTKPTAAATLTPLPPSVDKNPGLIPRGPGGGFQMPFSGAKAPAALEAFSLDDQYLKTYYRAPKGYVVVYDANGKPFPVLKTAAKAFGLWKPAKKPPISVKDWSALKRANSTVRKLKKVVKMAENVANFKSTRVRRVKCA